jgi:hypothetical protein
MRDNRHRLLFESGLGADIAPCRFRADFVAKVAFPKVSKILRAVGAVFV